MTHESRLLYNQGEVNSNQLGSHRQIERDPHRHVGAHKMHQVGIHQHQVKERLLPIPREEMIQAQEICHSHSTSKAESPLPRTREEPLHRFRNLREGLLLHKLSRRVRPRKSQEINNRSLPHSASQFRSREIRLGLRTEERGATHQEENQRISSREIKKLL